jgi:hypothetical protein
LYEKIAELPNTIETTSASIPYEVPSSSSSAPPPVPHAQTISEVVNEVETPEPYGQKVEAAHITEV